MEVINICEGSWTSNCYAVISDGHALVIDPSSSSKAIIETLASRSAVLDGILLTHGHFDHMISLDTLREKTSVPAYVHSDDAIMLTDGRKNAFYDFFGKERTYRPAEKLLSDNDIIKLGDIDIIVMHTPGHTPGSVCFLCNNVIFTGDTLFAESFGRCDLWGGDIEKMSESLRKLRTLDQALTIYAGHGPTAKLGDALDNVVYLI